MSGAAAPYTHTMALDESTRQATPTTAYIKDSDDLSYYVPDLSVANVTLTIPVSGAIECEFDR